MINFQSKMKIIKYNVDILFGVNTIIAAMFVGLMSLGFSFKGIDYFKMVKITELYLPLVGIILLAYITSIEKNNLIEELIYTKKFSGGLIFLMRLFINTMVISFLLVLLFLYAMYEGAIFPFDKVFIGSLVTAIFLGVLALTAYNLTNNLALGYMISFGYYFFEFSTKGKYSKEFYIFSLLKDSFAEKINLLIGVVVLLIINIIVMNYRRQNI